MHHRAPPEEDVHRNCALHREPRVEGSSMLRTLHMHLLCIDLFPLSNSSFPLNSILTCVHVCVSAHMCMYMQS